VIGAGGQSVGCGSNGFDNAPAFGDTGITDAIISKFECGKYEPK